MKIAQPTLSRYESHVTAGNGRDVFIRPILEDDGPLLNDLFNRLSPESRYFRFLSSREFLPEALIYQFTHLDYYRNFALAAQIDEEGRRAIIGVGRYGYDYFQKRTDFAIAVRDDWQRLGLGRILLEKLFAVGKEHGISRFTAEIDPQNTAIKQLIVKMGYDMKYTGLSTSLTFEIEV
jgi:acetyltransferase